MASKDQLPEPVTLKESLGPSFILLGLALGSGELILWPYLVSQYGLGIMWGGLLGITLQYFLNTEIMRYTLAHGESVFVGWRRWGKAVPWWFVVSTTIPWALPGFSSASGTILHHIWPRLSENIIAISLLIVTGLIISSGKTLYKTMERFQSTLLILGLPFILILTLLLAKSSDWISLLQGLVGRGEGWRWFPTGIAIGSFLGAFAYSGAGGNLGLAQSYYIKEKGFGMGKYHKGIKALVQGKLEEIRIDGWLFALTPTNLGRWRRWWKLVTKEHSIVFWGLGLATILLLAVLASSTGRGADASGLDFLFVEATTIGARLHPIVGTIFLLVSALFLFSTQVGVLESATRIVAENVLLLKHEVNEPVASSRAFYIILWLEISAGIILILAGIKEPRLLLTLGAILNAAAMMVAFPLILMLNGKRLPVAARTPIYRQAILVIATMIFVYFVVETIRAAL